MPFYEYQCKACGATHEALQKMSDAPLRKCPGCAKSQLVRLISAPVFRLKGGGWYETDFKSESESKRNLAGDDKADSAPAAASAKPAATKAETAKSEAPKAESAKAEAKPVASGGAAKSQSGRSKGSSKSPAKATGGRAKPSPSKASRR
jgi:putative FmdB family regulatory protein